MLSPSGGEPQTIFGASRHVVDNHRPPRIGCGTGRPTLRNVPPDRAMNRLQRAWLLVAVLLSGVASSPCRAAAPDWDSHPENVWVRQSPRDGAPAPGFGWEGSGDYDPFKRHW